MLSPLAGSCRTRSRPLCPGSGGTSEHLLLDRWRNHGQKSSKVTRLELGTGDGGPCRGKDGLRRGLPEPTHLHPLRPQAVPLRRGLQQPPLPRSEASSPGGAAAPDPKP